MLVRVRLLGSSKVRGLHLLADSFIVAGLIGVAVWAWGLSEGALYQYAQRIQFARSVAGGDSGTGVEEAPSESGPQFAFQSARKSPAAPAPRLFSRVSIPQI